MRAMICNLNYYMMKEVETDKEFYRFFANNYISPDYFYMQIRTKVNDLHKCYVLHPMWSFSNARQSHSDKIDYVKYMKSEAGLKEIQHAIKYAPRYKTIAEVIEAGRNLIALRAAADEHHNDPELTEAA